MGSFELSQPASFEVASGVLKTRANDELFALSHVELKGFSDAFNSGADLVDGNVDYVGVLSAAPCQQSGQSSFTCEIGIIFDSTPLVGCNQGHECHPTHWFEFVVGLNKDLRLLSVEWPIGGSRKETLVKTFEYTSVFFGGPITFRVVRNDSLLKFISDVGHNVCIDLGSVGKFRVNQVGIRWKSWADDPQENALEVDYLAAATVPEVTMCEFPLPRF